MKWHLHGRHGKMTDLTMRDTAFPNDQGPETDVMLIYIGGDTPHAWTEQDITSMDEKYLFPVWVRSNPLGYDGTAEAEAFVLRLQALKAPKDIAVCLDLEIAVDTAYVNAFNAAMRSAGYKVVKYGSLSAIFKNPKTDGGTFVADPTGLPHMITEGDTVATQYAFNGGYDMSLVLDTVPLWKAGSSTPPPPPADVTLTVTLPELQEGMSDQPGSGRKVARLQGLCSALGNPVAIDGVFGPATLAAVEAQQQAFGLSVDGIVGQETWGKLIAG